MDLKNKTSVYLNESDRQQVLQTVENIGDTTLDTPGKLLLFLCKNYAQTIDNTDVLQGLNDKIAELEAKVLEVEADRDGWMEKTENCETGRVDQDRERDQELIRLRNVERELDLENSDLTNKVTLLTKGLKDAAAKIASFQEKPPAPEEAAAEAKNIWQTWKL